MCVCVFSRVEHDCTSKGACLRGDNEPQCCTGCSVGRAARSLRETSRWNIGEEADLHVPTQVMGQICRNEQLRVRSEGRDVSPESWCDVSFCKLQDVAQGRGFDALRFKMGLHVIYSAGDPTEQICKCLSSEHKIH